MFNFENAHPVLRTLPSIKAITKIGNRGIRELGNRGIGESGNMETVRDIGMQFVV